MTLSLNNNIFLCTLCDEYVEPSPPWAESSSTQLLECTHRFHRFCLNHWINANAKHCPTCQTPIKKEKKLSDPKIVKSTPSSPRQFLSNKIDTLFRKKLASPNRETEGEKIETHDALSVKVSILTAPSLRHSSNKAHRAQT